MAYNGRFSLVVDWPERHQRLDAFITGRLAQISRSQAAHLIQNGHVLVDGTQRKAGYKIKTGEMVAVYVPPPVTIVPTAEAIRLEILHEDDSLIVINKPAGMVVHPAAGNWSGTLVNALLHHWPDLAMIGDRKRPGIVHRLDKETSGVLVVARTETVQQALLDQFKKRRIRKGYLAVVCGRVMADSGSIDLPVGRHPRERKKMSTQSPRGREALTLWRLVERFARASLLEIDLRTGRTHQIRVHCAAMGHRVLGDKVYGRSSLAGAGGGSDAAWRALLGSVQRHLLHARDISLTHPVTGAAMNFEAPLPADMNAFLERVRLL